MKTRTFKKAITAFTVLGVSALMVVASCTKTNQNLDVPPDESLPAAVTNPADLICAKTSYAPVIDGVIDGFWESAQKLNTISQVPDPGNGMFVGYIGTQYPLTLRAMYDATSIYFLAEIPDPDKSVQTSPWYFNQNTKRWAQEPSAKTFDINGNLTREGWGEDKLSFLWNIDNSVAKWASQSCYATCHMFQTYTDPTATPSLAVKPNQSGNHYTNGANEKIDMWWLKIGRDPLHSQFSDEYQDWAGGPSITSLVGGSGNGRHQDDQVVSGSSTSFPYGPTYSSNQAGVGTTNNSKAFILTVSGKTVSVNAPKYVRKNNVTSDNNYYIYQSEIDENVNVKAVTALDTMGRLTLSDGSTIDPNIGTDYQRLGAYTTTSSTTGTLLTNPYVADGPLVIPSYYSAPLNKGRADITCQVKYTGTGWIIEWKRLLKTPDVLKQDVDFSSLQDQPFGVAFFNKSNYQHGIKPSLTLKFQK